jgi:starch phosphorylase
VINLSVTDGWWGEGYDGDNGWAITPHGPQYESTFRNREEAHELLDILEHRVIPLYYQRNGHGYSEGWVAKSKSSMKSLMPRFNAVRMVMDYIRDYYSQASRQAQRLDANNHARAQALATWKQRVRSAWPEVKIQRADTVRKEVRAGDTLAIKVSAHLNGLGPEDVAVECLVGLENDAGEFQLVHTYPLRHVGPCGDNETLYRLEMPTELAGLQYYKLRMYPWHPDLSHRFEVGRMLWV